MSALRSYAAALEGVVISGNQVCFPGPGHSRQDRSCTLLLSRSAPDGFLVFSHAGDDWRVVRDHVRSRLGLSNERQDPPSIARAIPPAPDKARNREVALKLWNDAVPLPGTVGEIYFSDHRGIAISDLDDLSHALRWNERIHAVVGLMTDPVTTVATGIHRIFLDQHGAKVERKMLGRQGVVRLSPDEDVIHGLGLAEGIEDALAILASGWSPLWAATSAGSIARFPVLNGIDVLTIFSDADRAGYDAARACAERWLSADKEAVILPPHLNGRGQ